MALNNSDDSGSETESSGSGSNQNASPAHNQASRSGSVRSQTPGSRSSSRSGSPQSPHSSANSPNKNAADPEHPPNSDVAKLVDEDTRSQSPNLQIDDHASSRSRSRSLSRSGSGTPQRKSHSRSRSRSSSGGSRSQRSSLSRSRSRSRSGSSASPTPRKKARRAISSDSDDVEQKKTQENGAVAKTLKSRIIDSESENDDEATNKVDAQDIFGDADDISASSDDEKRSQEARRSKSRSRSRSATPRSRSRSRSRSSSGRSRSRSPQQAPFDIGLSQKEDEAEPVPETRIDVEIPRIVTDLGKDIHFVKLPNFLSVDTRPFDSETYEDEIDEEETMDEEGRQRIKLKVSNTIRWREYMNDKGDMVKESNARFVRWSDGSISMHLGNEIFDVYRQPLHGDHNHMFIRQGTGLQGQAVFRTKLTFRPHSTESFTHKKMTMSLADRSQKTSGIKILTQVGKDPTTDRYYLLKKEEEKLRQAARVQHRPQMKKKKTDPQGANASTYQHDEGSDDENAISLNAIKNKYKKGGATTAAGRKGAELKASAIYSSDEDEGSDFEQRRHKKIDKAKTVRALRDSDSDSDNDAARGGESDEDKRGSDNEKSGNDSGDDDKKSGSGSGTGSGSGDDESD